MKMSGNWVMQGLTCDPRGECHECQTGTSAGEQPKLAAELLLVAQRMQAGLPTV